MIQNLIQNDVRPIMVLNMVGEEGTTWRVGSIGVTRIEPYLGWFAVYRGDWLAYRVNVSRIESVWYGEAPEE